MVDLEGQLPSDISNIEEVSEQAACKLAMEQLQEQIELAFFHMQKKHQCIQDVAVSSKQRSALRSSVTKERKKISKLVARYQVLVHQIGDQPLVEEEILQGNFPWSALTVRSSIGLQQKLEIVDAFNTVERLEEEEVLLIKEMTQCISFIREHIEYPLVADIYKLEDIVNGRIVPRSDIQPQTGTHRYYYDGNQTAPIEGKISFLKRGLHFGRQLLQKCLLMFSPFLHNLDLYESEIQDSDTDNESTGCPADDYGESDIEWEETDDDN
jgi:hypothetical protein